MFHQAASFNQRGFKVSKIDDAYTLYKKHIYDEEKIGLLKKYNLKIAGSVPSVLWELFGAMLTGRVGQGTTGADLHGWEVKSAKAGGSYEYQYHLNTGAEKLAEDCSVNHLFCSYSETYKDVTVRAIKGQKLAASFFNAWMPEYGRNYDASVPASQRRQRFRKNISLGYVETHGKLILRIANGVLKERYDAYLDEFNEE